MYSFTLSIYNINKKYSTINSLCKSQNESYTKCSMTYKLPLFLKYTSPVHISIRNMMSGRSPHIARAAYHCLSAMTNPHVMNNIFKNDHQAFIDSTVKLSVDHTTGTIQHKSAFMRHLLSHKFDGQVFYFHFSKTTGIKTITCMEGFTDMRVMNELPVIQHYYNTFKDNIVNIQANLDTVVGNFHAQKQTNQDFNVTVKAVIKQIQGLQTEKALIIRPHDEKSGMGMFKHATRGTLGMLTYDANTNKNVQIMSSPTEMNALISMDKIHLSSVFAGLTKDGIYIKGYDDNLYHQALNILNNPGNTFAEQQYTHNVYQQFMWDNFHANQNYPRSISFIFPITIEYNNVAEQDPRYNAFKNQFSSLLKDRLYDLNKQSDCKEITFAMLKAYKDTVDPQILDKLQYLQNSAGLTFNSKFLLDLSSIMKQGFL